MGALGRIAAFIGGSVLGAGVGAAVAILAAPQSGDQFRQGLEQRVERVKLAGIEAQAETEEAMIRRFRAEIGDPDALQADAVQVRSEAEQAKASLNL